MLYHQSWRMHLTKRVYEPIWISMVKVIHWPWSDVTQIQHFKLLFLRLNPNFTWSLHGAWEWKWVQMVYVTWWPTCPYMVKIIKTSSLEPKGRWPWKLVCSIGYSSTIKIFNEDPAVTMTILRHHWCLSFCMGKSFFFPRNYSSLWYQSW